MIGRAQQTANLARMIRRHPVRRLPKQIYPKHLESAYAKSLRAFVGRLMLAFDPFVDELPTLLAWVVSERRIDSARFDAGEGKRIRELIRQAKEKMKSSILTNELDRLASDFAARTSSAQRMQLGRQVRAALGADVFSSDARIRPLLEAFADTNVGLITKLSDEMAGRMETAALRAVQDAKPWDEFKDEIKEQFGFSDSRAELIARDQIGKLYGQTNAIRQQELGVSGFIWRTSGDERVRDEHEAIDGDRFDYPNGHPTEGLPGEPILCRCTAEPDFSTIKDLM